MPADRNPGSNIHPLPGNSPAGAADAPVQKSPSSPRRQTSRLVWLVPGIIVVLGLGLGGTWAAHRYFGHSAPKWVTATVQTGDVEDTVTALGNLQPRNYVDVGAQVSGQLTRIDVAVGQKVKAGALLAEIDPTVLEAKVTADQAALAGLQAQLVDRATQLDLASKQFARQQNLMRDNATSEDALQTANATMRSDKAELAVLQAQAREAQSTLAADQANLGYTRIYAPMSGTVVALSAHQGQTINASQQAPVILRIADLATMTVWTQVSEADVPRLKIGMDAYFTTLGDQSDRWEGKLQQILPTPDIVNNVVLYPALFDVANPDGKLMTQMSAQVFFVVDGVKDAVTVPMAALRPVDGQPASGATGTGAVNAAASSDSDLAKPYDVRVVEPNGRAKNRKVWIGATNRTSAEVLSGLEPGDVVVIGQQSPDSGSGKRTGIGRLL